MTIRLHTVEYVATSVLTSTAANTTLTFSSVTLTVPETTSRTFVSAHLVYTARPNLVASVGSGQNPITCGVQLGAAGATTFSVTNFNQNYNNAETMEWRVDFTSYFNTNFGAGSTQTCVAMLKVQDAAFINAGVRIVLTYKYDDSAATRAKTVRIPLEGLNAYVGTSFTQVGGASEIPNLSTFLPESGVTINDIWFEIHATTVNNGSDNTITLALDSETGVALGNSAHAGLGNGDVGRVFFIWKRTDMTTNATHAFKLKTSQSSVMFNVCVMLCVSYTYTVSSTTTVLNSLRMSFDSRIAAVADISGSVSAHLQQIGFWVEEPSPTLVQSAVIGYQSPQDSGALAQNLMFAAGTQSARSFVSSVGAYTFGGIMFTTQPIQQRVDSGGTQGAAFSLARGPNKLTATTYVNDTRGTIDNTYNVFPAELILNYTSGVASRGVDTHNRTVQWLAFSSGTTTSPTWFGPNFPFGNIAGPSIPEASYFVTNFGEWVMLNGHTSFALIAQLGAGEGLGAGQVYWTAPGTFEVRSYYSPFVMGDSSVWQRYPNDPDTSRMAVGATRFWAMGGATSSDEVPSFGFQFTYHAVSYSIKGVVLGYSGDGSGITVNTHRADTGEVIATATTTVGGYYTSTWFDNTIAVYSEAYQDGTHLGRSVNGTAA